MKQTHSIKALVIASLMSTGSATVIAQQSDHEDIQFSPAEQAEVQDMSDPLAVYTQGGFGITDKGLNFKVGNTYDTGNPETMAMNVVEFKGIAGESLGWSDADKRDNSIDSVRIRNFKVNTTNGRGSQIDFNYNVARESLDASYSMIQALPQWGNLNVYPLAGLGVNIANGKFPGCDSLDLDCNIMEQSTGYTIPGTFGVVGAYTKYSVTDKFWLNYNPMWLTTISGSKAYTENAFGPETGAIFTHELAASYQVTPRFNVRYFANWSQKQSFGNGDHRIEVNYQF